MSNFIPNETMLMDDRDPPWIRKNIKGLIHDKKLVYKKHLKKNNSETQRTLYEIQDQILLAILLRTQIQNTTKSFQINSTMHLNTSATGAF